MQLVNWCWGHLCLTRSPLQLLQTTAHQHWWALNPHLHWNWTVRDHSLPGKAHSREALWISPGGGTVDSLFTLASRLEGSCEFTQPVHMCVVDEMSIRDRARGHQEGTWCLGAPSCQKESQGGSAVGLLLEEGGPGRTQEKLDGKYLPAGNASAKQSKMVGWMENQLIYIFKSALIDIVFKHQYTINSQ